MEESDKRQRHIILGHVNYEKEFRFYNVMGNQRRILSKEVL